eukprot:FR741054.1.p4 GENE.FR741054.1~~FR741054.1.p4  ORF type:complete len:100 (-),score=32.01 FR741054.1:481-780(-)
MTMIPPSAQLTLTKGNKSWSSTAVAAALELVDPLGSGPWLSLTAAAFFFFFFFFKGLDKLFSWPMPVKARVLPRRVNSNLFEDLILKKVRFKCGERKKP